MKLDRIVAGATGHGTSHFGVSRVWRFAAGGFSFPPPPGGLVVIIIVVVMNDNI